MKSALLRIDIELDRAGPGSFNTEVWWKNFRRSLVGKIPENCRVSDYMNHYLKENFGAVLGFDTEGRFLEFENEHMVSVFLLRWS